MDIEIYKLLKYRNTEEEQHLLAIELNQNLYLKSYWDNIRDLFCLNLPKKMDFFEISKVNIELGKFEGDKFEISRTNGIATYKIEDFNFNQFEKLSDLEKNIQSLDYIRSSLLDICNILNADTHHINLFNTICDKILSENFELARTFPKTTRWNKSRNIQAVTLMHHKPGGINVSVKFTNKDGDEIYTELIIENRFWESIYFDIWKGYWIDSKFIIENKNGDIFKTLTPP